MNSITNWEVVSITPGTCESRVLLETTHEAAARRYCKNMRDNMHSAGGPVFACLEPQLVVPPIVATASTARCCEKCDQMV